MYKKLMFLISFVCLLGLSLPLSADDLEVEWPDVYTVSGVEEYDEMDISGKVIVPAGATLIMNEESDLDGNGDDGEGGDGASIIVYGTFIMHNRLNMGCDHDAYLIIDGGIVEHDGDKVTVPDDSGGEHRIIIINGGSMVAEEIELIHDRDAKVILGCNATIEVCNTDWDDSRDPDQWLADGDLLCDVSCSFGIMRVTDLGNDCKEAICFRGCPPPLPRPADGAIHQVVAVDLEWRAGAGAVRYMIYFGTSYDGVFNAGTTDDEFQGYKNIGEELLWDLDVDSVPPVYLELWRTYYWRIDGYTPPDLYKGNVWSFTTGCSLVPGDINLDCVVNLLDYAMLADDWRDESFFPGGVVP